MSGEVEVAPSFLVHSKDPVIRPETRATRLPRGRDAWAARHPPTVGSLLALRAEILSGEAPGSLRARRPESEVCRRGHLHPLAPSPPALPGRGAATVSIAGSQ